MKRKGCKGEKGEVMLEGIIVMVITLFVLIWLLGLGFLYYQKYTVRIVSNDAAAKVAATYFNPQADIIMGYVSAVDVSDRSLYSSPDLEEINQLRAESYIRYILDKANFANTLKEVQVTLDYVKDSIFGRSHVVLTTEVTFDTAFGEGLELFGMEGNTTYRVTSYADSTSLSDYVSNVNYADALTDGTFLKGTGAVEKVVGFLNSFIKMLNKLTS